MEKLTKTLGFLLLVLIPVFSVSAQDGTSDMGTEPSSVPSTTAVETVPLETTTATPRATGTVATSSVSTEVSNPAPEPVVVNETFTPSEVVPQDTKENSAIPSLGFVAGVVTLALAGFGVYKLSTQSKNQGNNKNKSRCFDIKQLMDKKLEEMTDLKSQLQDKVKDKSREQIKEMMADTAFAGVLTSIESGEKEYNRLQALFNDCMVQFEKGKTILVDTVYTFVSDTGIIFDDMYQMLEKYPNRKILLTGANDEQFKSFGLNKMPYQVFTLKHNPEKTNPEYFRQTLAHFKLNKDDVVYFEHSAGAVKSAESIGITSYFYDEYKKDLKDLKKFLDSNL